MQAALQRFEAKPELLWFIPFLCIALATFSLLRSSPKIPVPEPNRIVVDANGTPVHIGIPYRGTVFTWGTGWPDNWLEVTHSPETILYTGEGPVARAFLAASVIGWIYPQVAKNGALWSSNNFFQSHGASEELETEIALNGGAYPGACRMETLRLLRRLGEPVLCLSSGHDKNWDEFLFSAARVQAALVGQPERADTLIARYKQAYVDLDRELQPATLPEHPRILITDIPRPGSGPFSNGPFYVKGPKNDYRIYLPPAGVVNASIGWSGERDDLERLLAMDPDYIFLMGNSQAETPQEFMHDPRWRGLKAVRDKQVYVIPGLPNSGGLAGLIFQPLWVRWMAEICHPDRLKPELRAVIRQTLLTEFNYRLSDDQIDALLRIQENSGSAGYARFTRDYAAPPASGNAATSSTVSEPNP